MRQHTRLVVLLHGGDARVVKPLVVRVVPRPRRVRDVRDMRSGRVDVKTHRRLNDELFDEVFFTSVGDTRREVDDETDVDGFVTSWKKLREEKLP